MVDNGQSVPYAAEALGISENQICSWKSKNKMGKENSQVKCTVKLDHPKHTPCNNKRRPASKENSMISKACKYGIRAVILVASKAEGSVKLNVKYIVKEVDAPEAFTAKILQTLNKHRIITSLKGPYGGFYMEEYQLEQPVMHIVNAIDGMSVFGECGLGLKQCSEKHPCPMHDQYEIARDAQTSACQNTTIRKLATELNQGTSFINNLI